MDQIAWNVIVIVFFKEYEIEKITNNQVAFLLTAEGSISKKCKFKTDSCNQRIFDNGDESSNG